MAGYWKNDPFGPSADGEVGYPRAADGTKFFFPRIKIRIYFSAKKSVWSTEIEKPHCHFTVGVVDSVDENEVVLGVKRDFINVISKARSLHGGADPLLQGVCRGEDTRCGCARLTERE